MSLGWTRDFPLPIRIGDVFKGRFTVGAMRASKSRPGWGIAVLPTELTTSRARWFRRASTA
jgi:acyl dehydratase